MTVSNCGKWKASPKETGVPKTTGKSKCYTTQKSTRRRTDRLQQEDQSLVDGKGGGGARRRGAQARCCLICTSQPLGATLAKTGNAATPKTQI